MGAPPRSGFIVVNTPGLKPGDRWGGCRRVYATRAEAEAIAGDRLGVSRWAVEVWAAALPILGGGPRSAPIGWADTRFIVAD